ncbi:MAG: hypothetical protein HBSAPP03_12150 [Phycisphaerae bacterium]|nr:MAG: hypothetical protein HBSAPP03_12150 [Phycisphaerae bacterium]
MPPTRTEPFAWKSFFVHVGMFGAVAVGLGVLAGAILGLEPLERRASARVARTTPHVRIVWPNSLPGSEGTWLPGDEQERLMRLAYHAVEGGSSFSRMPLERLSQSMADSGWFRGTPIVRRDTHGYVVEGSWRVPAAVVRAGEKDYLISWEASPLPKVYPAGGSRLPAILNPAQTPPMHPDGMPDKARPWPGEDVGAALELLATAASQPWAGQVAGVDVSKYAAEGSLMLVTRGGNTIVWGGRPTKPRLGEVSTAQKLIHLSQLRRDFGTIDAGYPLIYVNTDRLQFDTTATARQQAGVDDRAPL